jgi:hypothetical protein
MFALLFLNQDIQRRFVFKHAAPAPPRLPVPVIGDAAVVEYQEIQPNTLIQTRGGGDLFARGRFWIEADSGRVLVSELVAETKELRVTIDVSYRDDPSLGFLVPAEMREHLETLRDGTIVTGTAQYDRFRRFQVSVDEKIWLDANP